MHASFVETITSDHLLLPGILFEPAIRGDTALLFIHGKGGSLASDPTLVEALKRNTLDRGIAFLTVNTRGHDYLANGNTFMNGVFEERQVGHCVERFEDSVLDIAAWIDLLGERGYTKIVLLGHSLGALKATFYLTETGDSRVKALVLVSPPDIFGLLKKALGGRSPASCNDPSSVVSSPPPSRSKRGSPESFLAGDMDYPWPISNATIESFVGQHARTNLFPFHARNGDFSLFAKLTLPVFVCWGTREEALVTRPPSALRRLRRCTKSLCFRGHIFKDVPHSYRGAEEKLARAVMKWLKQIF